MLQISYVERILAPVASLRTAREVSCLDRNALSNSPSRQGVLDAPGNVGDENLARRRDVAL